MAPLINPAVEQDVAVGSRAAMGNPQPRTRRLRIAVVTPELHRNRGTERTTSEIVGRLAQHHDICLFAHRWEPDGHSDVCFHPVRVLPGPGLVQFMSFFASASWAVNAAAQHAPFDVVYSPGPNGRSVEVCTAHFCQARQRDLLFSGEHRPPPVTLRDRLKLVNRMMYSTVAAQIERWFYRSLRLQRVVSPSRSLARDLTHYYGLPPERIVVAHSGVDAEAFSPEERAALRQQARAELGLRDGQFAFLFLGNNWLVKGLKYIIEALAKIPEAQLLVVAAREDPESYQHFSLQLGVAERVRYLPRRPDVIFFYAAADALVAPSVYDTFGLMPLEAAACGLPSIITRSMGVAEVLTPSEALILERAGDVEALAEAMRRMMSDAALRARLSAAGIQRARLLSWERMYEATLQALLETAQAGSTAHPKS